MKSWSLWILAWAIALAVAAYHYTRGPLGPVRGSKDVGGEVVAFELHKSHSGEGDALVRIPAGASVGGSLLWRPHKSSEKWTYLAMPREGGALVGRIPHQPVGSLVDYRVVLQNWGERVWLTGPPVVLRFQGEVPTPLLPLHLGVLFLALLFSARAGLEAWMAKEPRLEGLAKRAAVLLAVGGVALGAAAQWYARGGFQSSWPVGGDWTIASTLGLTLLWLLSLVAVRKGQKLHSVLVLASAMATVSVFVAAHGFGA